MSVLKAAPITPTVLRRKLESEAEDHKFIVGLMNKFISTTNGDRKAC